MTTTSTRPRSNATRLHRNAAMTKHRRASTSTIDSGSTSIYIDDGSHAQQPNSKQSSSRDPSSKSLTSVALHLDLGVFSHSHLVSSRTENTRPSSHISGREATSTQQVCKQKIETRQPLSTEASRQKILERIKDDKTKRKKRKPQSLSASNDSSQLCVEAERGQTSIMSRDDLERIRGMGRRQGMSPPPLSPVGMVVATKKRSKQNISQSPAIKDSKHAQSQKKRNSKRMRTSITGGCEGTRKTGQETKRESMKSSSKSSSRLKQNQTNKSPSALTKDRLKENCRASDQQSHLQNAVASSIQLRLERPTLELHSFTSRGLDSRRAQWQSCYRGYFVRRVNEREIDILKIRDGAMRQTWTGYFSDIQFHLDLIDIITIQSSVRKKNAKSQFDLARNSTIRIQQLARKHLAQKRLRALRRRRRHQKKALLKKERRKRQNDCAILIQKRWRSFSDHGEYIMVVSSIICLQAAARRFLAISLVERHQKLRNRSATAIQSCWRRHLVRPAFLLLHAKALLIQRHIRRCLAKWMREDHILAAVMIQAQFRRLLWRGLFENCISIVTEIQAAARRRIAEKRYQLIKVQREERALHIQSAVRRYLAVCEFKASMRRKQALRSSLRDDPSFRDQSSISSLVSWTSQCSRFSQEISEGEGSAQPYLPSACSRSSQYTEEHSYPDSNMESQQDNANVAAAALATAVGVAAVAGVGAIAYGRHKSSKAQDATRAAITIQSAVRRFIGVRSLTLAVGGITKLQASVRGAVARQAYKKAKSLKRKKSRSSLPFMIRSAALRLKKRVDVKLQSMAASTIQKYVRRFRAMQQYQKLKDAKRRDSVVVLQACVRRYLAELSFRRSVSAAIGIQRLTRRMVVRMNLLICHFAASEIQWFWREYRYRNNQLYAATAAAIHIQAFFRKMSTQKAARKLWRNRNIAAIRIQCQLRRLSARRESDLKRHHTESTLSICSFSCSGDMSLSRADVHAKLLAFESKRRSTYAPLLKSSFLKWRASVDSLQTSVEEMVNAERLIFGSAIANQAMQETMSPEALLFEDDAQPKKHSGFLGRNKKQQQIEASVKQPNTYMEISDEMTQVREELESKVNTLSELGDAIIADLESAEIGVVESWDAYDASAVESMDRDSSVGSPGTRSSKNAKILSDLYPDLWMDEMRYRVSVAFQVMEWQRATAELTKIFTSVSKTERKHRSRLRELLLVFASRRRQEISSYASMQTQDLQELVDQQVDQIHPQIEELIRETESRPFTEDPCLNVESNDFTTLDSPMTSNLLHVAKIIERKIKGGLGRRSAWTRTLVILTADSFMHLFDMSASAPETDNADEAFHELILISQVQKLEFHANLFEALTPVTSVFLPNCSVRRNSRDRHEIELRENYLGKRGKVTTRKLQLRGETVDDTQDLMTDLDGWMPAAQ